MLEQSSKSKARRFRFLGALTIAAAAMAGCSGTPQATENSLVRLAAHDSFVISDELIAELSAATGYQLEVVRLGDTGSLTNQLILTKDAPVADAVYGIDNTFLPSAIEAGLLEGTATAINYGDVCFNYDLAWFAEAGLEPPANWRALVRPEFRELTVISNPLLSSPGLAFLASTFAGFESDAEVFEYWRQLRDNGLRVASSWDDAYFVDYTRYGGDRPIVLSYAASPSAEVNEDGSAGSAALLDECFRQTEYAGVIAGSANPEGAAAAVEFLAGAEFQASVAENMYVYPMLESTPLPESWQKFAPAARIVIGEDLDIAAERERWLTDWSSVFDN